MSLDRSSVYFTAQSTPSEPNGFVISFHHLSSGLALSMAEATMLTGLPEGMVLRSHPGLPGRAAWSYPGNILQAGMGLRRADFGSSPKEVANPRDVPPRPTVVAIARPGPLPQDSYEPDEPEAVHFNLKTREENGKMVARVALAEYCEEEDCLVDLIEPRDFVRCEQYKPLADILLADRDYRFLSNAAPDELRKRLTEAGFTENEEVLIWFEPEELEFGVSREPVLHDELHIFVLPLDEDAPFVDDLRDEHLKEVPPYFDDNLCENTWSLKPGTSRETVISDMKSRGYRHNPELDGEVGG